jgi:hypothetical protein
VPCASLPFLTFVFSGSLFLFPSPSLNLYLVSSINFLKEVVSPNPPKTQTQNTDLVENPDRFFAAHRNLAAFMTTLSPGFWIRLTVHFNLFCGTVLALGGPDQIAMLHAFQKKGYLGCFGLTEKFAGLLILILLFSTLGAMP